MLQRESDISLTRDIHEKHPSRGYRWIKDHVHYYNNERPAYSLKYKTPIQFKFELGLSGSFL